LKLALARGVGKAAEVLAGGKPAAAAATVVEIVANNWIDNTTMRIQQRQPPFWQNILLHSSFCCLLNRLQVFSFH